MKDTLIDEQTFRDKELESVEPTVENAMKKQINTFGASINKLMEELK